MTHNTRLLDAAMTVAMACVADGETLQPFVITEGGTGAILSIVGESIAERLSIVQRAVDELAPDVTAWAFVYDGFLTLGEERTDAIFVELGESSAAGVNVYAQRYSPAKPSIAVEKIGGIGRLSKMTPRIRNTLADRSAKNA